MNNHPTMRAVVRSDAGMACLSFRDGGRWSPSDRRSAPLAQDASQASSPFPESPGQAGSVGGDAALADAAAPVVGAPAEAGRVKLHRQRGARQMPFRGPQV